MKQVGEIMTKELGEVYEEFANTMLEAEKESLLRQELTERVKSMIFSNGSFCCTHLITSAAGCITRYTSCAFFH